MLILITNSCGMNCPHCLQDSIRYKNKGESDMSLDTLSRIIDVIPGACGPLMISGGEPTEHQEFSKLMNFLNDKGRAFLILSNGTWAFDENKRVEVENVLKLDKCIGMQVYSNKKYYKDYDKIVSHFSSNPYPKATLVTNEIQSMEDLGRARYSELTQDLINSSDHLPSCVNACLASYQSYSFIDLVYKMMSAGKFCTPMIDSNGDIHLSESRLCKSYGNIHMDIDKINANILYSSPCGKCRLYKNIAKSKKPGSDLARFLFSIEPSADC